MYKRERQKKSGIHVPSKALRRVCVGDSTSSRQSRDLDACVIYVSLLRMHVAPEALRPDCISVSVKNFGDPMPYPTSRRSRDLNARVIYVSLCDPRFRNRGLAQTAQV